MPNAWARMMAAKPDKKIDSPTRMWALFYQDKLSTLYIFRPANGDVVSATERATSKSWQTLESEGWSVRKVAMTEGWPG